jgi:hypothetical protein
MTPAHRQAFNHELAAARRLMGDRRIDQAFVHLERAHVLGQNRVSLHVLTHWHMLRVALLRRDMKAVLGQLARIVLGAIGSAVGAVPSGNTGGTDVSMFRRMPIDPELLSIMQQRMPEASAKANGADQT